MSRFAVVLIAVLTIAWGAAVASDAAAAAPVQNVHCVIGDDGAGFTSAQIAPHRPSTIPVSIHRPPAAGLAPRPPLLIPR